MSQLPRLLHSKMSFPDSEIYSFLPILSYCAGDIVYKGGQRQPPLPSKCRPEEVRAANPCPKLRRGFFDAGHAIADAKVAHYHARQALTRAEEAALRALFSVSYIYRQSARLTSSKQQSRRVWHSATAGFAGRIVKLSRTHFWCLIRDQRGYKEVKWAGDIV